MESPRPNLISRNIIIASIIFGVILIGANFVRNYDLWATAQSCYCGPVYIWSNSTALEVTFGRQYGYFQTPSPPIISGVGVMLTGAGGGLLGMPTSVFGVVRSINELRAEMSRDVDAERQRGTGSPEILRNLPTGRDPYQERELLWLRIFVALNVSGFGFQLIVCVIDFKRRFRPADSFAWSVLAVAGLIFVICAGIMWRQDHQYVVSIYDGYGNCLNCNPFGAP
jgi:hypothetical protein